MLHRSTISSPLAIPNCKLWLDAFDESTITKASNLVSVWADKSGSGYDASQATGTSQPTYSATGLNSRPCLTFATNKGLANTANSLTRNVPGLTLFCVAVTTDRTALQRYFAAHTNNTARQWVGMSIAEPSATGTGDLGVGGRRLIADGFVGIKSGTLTNNSPYIHGGTFDYQNTRLLLHSNGSQLASNTSFQVSGNSEDVDPFAFSVGALGTGTAMNNPILGSIGEIIVYQRALSDAERRRVEWYLSLKWNLNCA